MGEWALCAIGKVEDGNSGLLWAMAWEMCNIFGMATEHDDDDDDDDGNRSFMIV